MRLLQNVGALALLGVLILTYVLAWPQYFCSAKSILSSLSTNINTMTPEFNQTKSTGSTVVPYIPTTLSDYPLTQRITNFSTKFYQSKKYNKIFNDSQRVLSRTDRSVDLVILNNSLSGVKRVKNYSKASILERNERSTNLSHIAGSTRRIQLYIKNRFLQILPDGTVNGTTDDSSEHTIVQRTTVNVGQIKIQALATCLFLCMDSCGLTYGSAQFNEDCVFNESIEQHHYNTYSSTYHSNEKRKLYLGLNRHGQTRKVILPSSRQLGKLSTYTNSLTHPIPHDRVNKLLEKIYGPNHGRHSLKQLCESAKVVQESGLKMRQKCDGNSNTKLNKKKKMQKCPEQGNCTLAASGLNTNSQQNKTDQSIKISDKKKQQSAHNQRKCQQTKEKDNVAVQKSEKKKNNNNNKNGSNQNAKANKSERKCNNNNKTKQNKKRKRKKITTTPKSEIDLKPNAANEDDNFASDESDEMDEDEYDDIAHGIKNPSSNFVYNNDLFYQDTT